MQCHLTRNLCNFFTELISCWAARVARELREQPATVWQLQQALTASQQFFWYISGVVEEPWSH